MPDLLKALPVIHNLMTPTDQLDLFIDNYLKETDKKRIQNISLSIPGHNGDFWIIDSMSLSFNPATLTFEQLESFSLAIYFSFSDKGKKGVFLTGRIAKSECFKDFTIRPDSRLKVYIKDKYIDKMEIVE